MPGPRFLFLLLRQHFNVLDLHRYIAMGSAGVQWNELTGFTEGQEKAKHSCGNSLLDLAFSIYLYGLKK